MRMDVDMTASADTHGVDAGSFPKDVVIVSMVAFKIVLPLTGETKILAFVIGKRLRRF
jgi:hypothetical protein